MRFALFRNSVMLVRPLVNGIDYQLVEKNINIAKRFIFGYYDFSEDSAFAFTLLVLIKAIVALVLISYYMRLLRKGRKLHKITYAIVVTLSYWIQDCITKKQKCQANTKTIIR